MINFNVNYCQDHMLNMRLMKLERENGEETYEKKGNCSGIWLTVSIYSTMQCFVRLGPTIFGGKIGERREKLLKDLYRTNGQLAIRETQSKGREERGINRGEREEKEKGDENEEEERNWVVYKRPVSIFRRQLSRRAFHFALRL